MSLIAKIIRNILSGAHGPKARSGSFLQEIQKLAKLAPTTFVLFSLVWLYWYCATSTHNKLVAMGIATGFSCVEHIFTLVTVDEKSGDKIGTTMEQWLVHTLFMPFMIPWYQYVSYSIFSYDYVYNINIIIAETSIDLCIIIFAPLFCWILEIMEGYFLIYFFGYNRAWQYFGKDALFNGTIKLGYWWHWIVLTFFIELFGRPNMIKMDVLSILPSP